VQVISKSNENVGLFIFKSSYLNFATRRYNDNYIVIRK